MLSACKKWKLLLLCCFIVEQIQEETGGAFNQRNQREKLGQRHQ